MVEGEANCGHFTAGHRFTLERHFNADGDYVLGSVEHTAELAAHFRSGGPGEGLVYTNRFGCFPLALPFRPPRITPRPVMHGPQTAVVVGPPGETVFCDKYGRVKVQFHWDREGKRNADSSWASPSRCWWSS